MTSYSQLFAALSVFLLPCIAAKEVGYDVPKPIFKAPGRRISEEKCLEYNWERKRLEKDSNDSGNIEYPYMGAVGYSMTEKNRSEFLCGAFLISPKFAITAAHCLQSIIHFIPQFVRFGNSDIKADVPRVDVKIIRTITHPEFNLQKRVFDIGLLELEESLSLTRSVQPACLWAQPTLPDAEYGLAPGWGTGVHDRTNIHPVLRVMKVMVIDPEECKAQEHYVRNWSRLEEHQLCGNESVSDVRLCSGSAGVPLVTMGKLDGEDQMPYAFGVTSFGVCYIWPRHFLSVYTKVSSFIDWIEQTVWPTESSA